MTAFSHMKRNAKCSGGKQVGTRPMITIHDHASDPNKCVELTFTVGLFTLNLVRWLSRMGSLYRQLQQLPIASAGQLKPDT